MAESQSRGKRQRRSLILLLFRLNSLDLLFTLWYFTNNNVTDVFFVELHFLHFCDHHDIACGIIINNVHVKSGCRNNKPLRGWDMYLC